MLRTRYPTPVNTRTSQTALRYFSCLFQLPVCHHQAIQHGGEICDLQPLHIQSQRRLYILSGVDKATGWILLNKILLLPMLRIGFAHLLAMYVSSVERVALSAFVAVSEHTCGPSRRRLKVDVRIDLPNGFLFEKNISRPVSDQFVCVSAHTI